MGLSQYIKPFDANGYDHIDEIKELQDGDLKRMGIESVAHRRKIMGAIAKLNMNQRTSFV